VLILFEFSEANAAKDWQTVNDEVPRSVSEGKFRSLAAVLRHAVAGEHRRLTTGADHFWTLE
jgi:hypothetical protein